MSQTLFICPYNPAHIVKPTRAHHHIVICRKANLHRNFIICSYNALHHYPPEKEVEHLATCADRMAIMSSHFATYEKRNFVAGDLSMPPPARITFEKEEGWGEEE